MATYKVLQDIEAEDKLLGPLSLKQFIFAIITVGLLFINFRILTASALGIGRWPLIAVLLPPTLLFGILAAPIGKDQPTEIWLLARIRFYLKPRRRIWDQDGPKELVTITAPKRVEKHLVKDITQGEVRSRLDALANVMDSRGWAVKNVNVNLSATPTYLPNASDDRLVGTESLPQDVSTLDIQASDDIMDERTNSTAQHFEQMIAEADRKHREQLQNQIESARNNKTQAKPSAKVPAPAVAADSWFESQQSAATDLPPPNLVSGGQGQTVAPNSSMPSVPVAPIVPAPTVADEQALLEKVHANQAQHQQASGFGHMKTLKPIDEQLAEAATAAQKTPVEPSPPAVNPDIINLARDNDKTVETLARQANKPKETKLDDGEVVVSLH